MLCRALGAPLLGPGVGFGFGAYVRFMEPVEGKPTAPADGSSKPGTPGTRKPGTPAKLGTPAKSGTPGKAGTASLLASAPSTSVVTVATAGSTGGATAAAPGQKSTRAGRWYPRADGPLKAPYKPPPRLADSTHESLDALAAATAESSMLTEHGGGGYHHHHGDGTHWPYHDQQSAPVWGHHDFSTLSAGDLYGGSHSEWHGGGGGGGGGAVGHGSSSSSHGVSGYPAESTWHHSGDDHSALAWHGQVGASLSAGGGASGGPMQWHAAVGAGDHHSHSAGAHTPVVSSHPPSQPPSHPSTRPGTGSGLGDGGHGGGGHSGGGHSGSAAGSARPRLGSGLNMSSRPGERRGKDPGASAIPTGSAAKAHMSPRTVLAPVAHASLHKVGTFDDPIVGTIASLQSGFPVAGDSEERPEFLQSGEGTRACSTSTSRPIGAAVAVAQVSYYDGVKLCRVACCRCLRSGCCNGWR